MALATDPLAAQRTFLDDVDRGEPRTFFGRPESERVIAQAEADAIGARIEALMAQAREDARADVREVERVDAAVFRIRVMNMRLTQAQERGDRAAQLIIEGQLAAMRA